MDKSLNVSSTYWNISLRITIITFYSSIITFILKLAMKNDKIEKKIEERS